MREVSLFLVLILLGVAPAAAQSSNATVNGIVLDPSGAVIAGAQVVVVNDATGVQYTTKTNGEGIYVVPNLPPGSYRIQVSNSGFKTIIKPDIVVHVQDALAINFTLPIGAASEIVTVRGGAPLVNTESGSVSTVIDREFVSNLPLNGRSFNTLLQLTPGVVIAQTPNSFLEPGQFSIAGQRTDANSFVVDGVSANFGVVAGLGPGGSGTGAAQAFSVLGGTSALVSVDALQEFRVQTSSFAPEFGRTPGGQVFLTTRSGTNAFHGDVFEYFRNTDMDANNWFANASGLPRAPEHHNDFGGILGGPIWRDKTFFFVSYEGGRLILPGTEREQVPSRDLRNASSTPAQLLPFLNAYPLPNGAVSPGDYTAQFTGNYSSNATLNATSVRVDHTFSNRFSIFSRYNYAPSRLRSVYHAADFETVTANTQTATAGVNMLLSNRIVNTLRANYSSQESNLTHSLTSFGGAVPPSPSLWLGSLSAGDNLIAFQTRNTSTWLEGPVGRNRTRQINFVDDLSLPVGKHQLKFGADYRGIFLDTSPFQHRVAYNASTVQNFVSTGTVNLFVITQNPAQLLTSAFSIYGQDTWKPTSRLALTYGLRWEIDPAPKARGKTTLSSWNNTNDPAAIALAAPGTPLWSTSYGNVAPRVGMAYSLDQKRTFVLRAGGGIFYDLGVGTSSFLASAFPNSGSNNHPNTAVPVADISPFLPVPSRQAPYAADPVYAFAPNLYLPRSYQWNVALEKSFGGQQVISATYVGQAGRDLLRQTVFFQPNSNFVGEFVLNYNGALSNYNALQLQYRKPLSGHLQALLNYTWSHSLDSSSDDQTTYLPGNGVGIIRGDYGSSDFDVRHSFSGALSYSIPSASKSGFLSILSRDWSLDAVVVARTGFPFSAVVYASSPDPEGFAYARPDLVPGQPVWVASPTAPGGKILNASAFSIPSTPRQGTEGRNDIPGFGLTQVDFSIARKFPMREQLNLQFRADAFNLFNHPNFGNPGGYIEFGPSELQAYSMLNGTLGGLNPLFQEGGPRSLQLSLKLSF